MSRIAYSVRSQREKQKSNESLNARLPPINVSIYLENEFGVSRWRERSRVAGSVTPSMSSLAILRSLVLSSVLASPFVTAGCQSPRATRINNARDLFNSLSRFHQKIVQDGLIDYGFSSAVVRMTLGEPS